MGGGRLSGFCLNRISTHARTPSESKPIAEAPRDEYGEAQKQNWAAKSEASRKIMIVVDSSPEARRAVLWALSHTVQDHDTVVLLHIVPVSKPQKPRGSDDPEEEPKKQMDLRDYEVPTALKTLCNSRRPEVEVEVLVVEGKDKGPAIVCQARKQSASLLVLGQRKPSLLWRLLIAWAGGKGKEGAGFVEYCIQNAECMTVAVRRKSRRGGGYIITTKRQRNFWLLA